MTEYSYQWYRDGQMIPGATDPNYIVQPADVGTSLTAVVGVGGSTSATSPVRVPLFSEDFTDYDQTVWWANLPYYGPNRGGPDPAGDSYNAWQGEDGITPFAIIQDPTATNGSALRITCRRTSAAEAAYCSSAWVGGATTTIQHFTFDQSIYFEWRMRLAGQGVGMFPALWINDASVDGGGPSVNPPMQQGGELDMLEVFGTPQSWSTTVWYKTEIGPSRIGLNAGRPTTDVTDWHTYGLAWTPTTLRFTQDGIQTGEADAQAGYFDGIEVDIRLNFTVGTVAEGYPPDDTTPDEMFMDVDYVYVFGGGK